MTVLPWAKRARCRWRRAAQPPTRRRRAGLLPPGGLLTLTARHSRRLARGPPRRPEPATRARAPPRRLRIRAIAGMAATAHGRPLAQGLAVHAGVDPLGVCRFSGARGGAVRARLPRGGLAEPVVHRSRGHPERQLSRRVCLRLGCSGLFLERRPAAFHFVEVDRPEVGIA
jgi:hypothetical protein